MDSIEYFDDDFQQEDQVRLHRNLSAPAAKRLHPLHLPAHQGGRSRYKIFLFRVKQRGRYGHVLQQDQCGQRAHQHPVS